MELSAWRLDRGMDGVLLVLFLGREFYNTALYLRLLGAVVTNAC